MKACSTSCSISHNLGKVLLTHTNGCACQVIAGSRRASHTLFCFETCVDSASKDRVHTSRHNSSRDTQDAGYIAILCCEL